MRGRAGSFFILFGQIDQSRVDPADSLTDTPYVGCGIQTNNQTETTMFYRVAVEVAIEFTNIHGEWDCKERAEVCYIAAATPAAAIEAAHADLLACLESHTNRVTFGASAATETTEDAITNEIELAA